MDNLPSEKNNTPYSKDSAPFTERKFDSAPPKVKAQSFLDSVVNSRVPIPQKKKKAPEAPKSIMEKRQAGLSRSELRTELKKIPYDKVGLYEKDRVAVEGEMSKNTYGEHIDIKDVDKHIKNLKKQESTAATEKERIMARHKEALLKKLEEKK